MLNDAGMPIYKFNIQFAISGNPNNGELTNDEKDQMIDDVIEKMEEILDDREYWVD